MRLGVRELALFSQVGCFVRIGLFVVVYARGYIFYAILNNIVIDRHLRLGSAWLFKQTFKNFDLRGMAFYFVLDSGQESDGGDQDNA